MQEIEFYLYITQISIFIPMGWREKSNQSLGITALSRGYVKVWEGGSEGRGRLDTQAAAETSLLPIHSLGHLQSRTSVCCSTPSWVNTSQRGCFSSPLHRCNPGHPPSVWFWGFPWDSVHEAKHRVHSLELTKLRFHQFPSIRSAVILVYG